jgi:formate dehydrogenase subunit delta
MHVHSPTDTLVRMANDIGNFFRAQGEERAIMGISNHIRLFWEPRMKKQIFEHLHNGGAGLNPLTLKALQKLSHDMRGKSTAAEAQAALAEMAEVGPDLVLDSASAGGKTTAAPQKNGKRPRR